MRPPDVAIWREGDLDGYVGGLRRVPPVLAVMVADPHEDRAVLRAIASDFVAAGVETVWIVDPERESIESIAAGIARSFTGDDPLPETVSLAGLRPAVRELLGSG